jgi:hypothetical protein
MRISCVRISALDFKVKKAVCFALSFRGSTVIVSRRQKDGFKVSVPCL